MRLWVKPRSGILLLFLSPRGPSALTIGHPALASLLPLSWHSFSPAALPSPRGWGRAAGEKECPVSADAFIHGSLLAKTRVSAGVCYGPSRSPGQPSIRVTPATDATTPYLVRTKRPRRQIKSPPIERTAPLQVTRRHNGDSLRLAFAAAIAAVTSLLCCSLLARSHGSDRSPGYRGRLLRVTPSR